MNVLVQIGLSLLIFRMNIISGFHGPPFALFTPLWAALHAPLSNKNVEPYFFHLLHQCHIITRNDNLVIIADSSFREGATGESIHSIKGSLAPVALPKICHRN